MHNCEVKYGEPVKQLEESVLKIRNYSLGTNGIKIVLLSDFHNKPYEHLIKTTAAIKPDIIAVAGDLTYGFKQYDRVAEFLNACRNIAPTFVSLGNHDVAEIIEPMCTSAQGVIFLDNSYVDIMVKGIPLRIGGLSSPTSRY